MPVWSDQPGIVMEAITTLVKLYRSVPAFESEFERICQSHRDSAKYFVLSWIESHRDAVVLSESEYQAMLDNLARNLADNKAQEPDFNAFMLELDELALRWKFKLPSHLASFRLFVEAVCDEIESLGVKLQDSSSFHPYRMVRSPPLRIEIPSWKIIRYGQEQTVKYLREVVSKYTADLKQKGLSHFPDSLEEHARWWFESYVLGKSYPEIGQDYYVSPETIKRKVWEFRQLLSIQLP